MALLQKTIVDQIEITANNVVQIRLINQISDDSFQPEKIIANEYQRHCIIPGQDYSNEEPKVQAICAVIHTPQVIADYKEII